MPAQALYPNCVWARHTGHTLTSQTTSSRALQPCHHRTLQPPAEPCSPRSLQPCHCNLLCGDLAGPGAAHTAMGACAACQPNNLAAVQLICPVALGRHGNSASRRGLGGGKRAGPCRDDHARMHQPILLQHASSFASLPAATRSHPHPTRAPARCPPPQPMMPPPTTSTTFPPAVHPRIPHLHARPHASQINAEKSPFLTERLKIWMLPTLALIQNEKTVDYVAGFDQLGGKDDFDTSVLAERLAKSEMIDYDWSHGGKAAAAAPSAIRKGGAAGFKRTDSDEDSDFD